VGLLVSGNRMMALPGLPDSLRQPPERPELVAVELAVQMFNQYGLRAAKTPLELVVRSPGYAAYGWGLPEDELVWLARRPEIVGVVGHVDRDAGSMRALLARLGMPLVNTADCEALSGGIESWEFPCRGDEPLQCGRLIDYLIEELALTRIALICTPEAESVRQIQWWRERTEERRLPPVTLISWDETSGALDTVGKSLAVDRPEAVLTWCGSASSAALLSHVRRGGSKAVFVGKAEIAGESFLREAGERTGPVIAVVGGAPRPGGERYRSFVDRYGRLNTVGGQKQSPDGQAQRSLLALDHLATAWAAAGSNRADLRNELEAMAASVHGEEHCTAWLAPRPLTIARLRDGRWEQIDYPGQSAPK
jgi:hypothetical protein